MTRRVLLGELLVEAQVISREALDHVLAAQKQDGRRLGTLLVELGLVTETQVTQILSQQLSIPWVSLYHIDFSRQLLNLVPRELVEKYCLVPIFVRRVRGVGETLYVAMDDPSDERAREEVSHYAGLPVRAMIAPPSDIREAIRVYYGAHSVPPPWTAQEPATDVGAAVARAPAAAVAGVSAQSAREERPQEAPVVEAAAAPDDVAPDAAGSRAAPQADSDRRHRAASRGVRARDEREPRRDSGRTA
jgi:type IV pilus assembly protein PilB